MVSSLYTASSGMIAEERRLSVIANNLANVDTNGFKQDEIVFSSYVFSKGLRVGSATPTRMAPNLMSIWFDPQNTVTFPSKSYTSFLPGKIVETGVTTNMAIGGEGFFTVSYNGKVFYTRDGSFRVYPDGLLRNSTGAILMGRRTPGAPIEEIRVNPGAQLFITSDGWVVENGNRTYKIEVTLFPGNPNDYLEKVGNNLFSLINPANTGRVVENPELFSGYIEKSNVDVVIEMVKLIECFRHYEACQKVVQATFDDVTAKTVNDVGRVG